MELRKTYFYLFKIVFSGLEEFEEKIDALGENEEEKPSWLGSILQGVFDEADLGEENEEGVVEGSIVGDEEDLDYVEPPFLDTRLGGGENTHALVRRRRAEGRRAAARIGKQNDTTEEEKLKEEEEEERSCSVELWRCLAHALEPAVRQIETSGSIAR